jgi:hypothetical protein
MLSLLKRKLRGILTSGASAGPTHWPRRKRPSLRPVVESLEQRRLLAVFTVTDPGDDGHAGQLRWAVDQSNNTPGPNQIRFAFDQPTTIVLTQGQLVIQNAVSFINDALPRDGVVISGNNASRIMDIYADTDINGLTLTQANPGLSSTSQTGGAIRCSSGIQLTIEHSDLTDNLMPWGNGGTVYAPQDTVVITASQFVGNRAGIYPFVGDGAGIYCTGSLTLSDDLFAYNTATGVAGGVFDGGTGASLVASDCQFIGNYSGTFPGLGVGAGILSIGTMMLYRDVFASNHSTGNGGGVYNGGPAGVISGCDFHNNVAERDGAAIINDGHPLAIDHTDIGFNSAGASGGGIFARNLGSLTIDACSIHDNSAVTYGGGLNIGAYVTGEITCTITNTDFVHNSAEFGGGIHEIVIVFNLSGVRLLDNSATIYGGGLLLENGDSHLSQCVIEGNSAPYAAAGLYYDGAEELGNTTAVVDQCLIDNNHATANSQYPGDGGGVCFSGGMYFGAASELDIRNSTVSENTASGVGGGILWRSGQYHTRLLIEATTVAVNHAQTGGGLYSEPHYPFTTPPDVHSSIIADNTAGSSPDVFGPVHSLGYNLVQDPGSSSGWTGSDLLGVDPLLGPLQDNGGPTWTHALLAGSPAIGAGDRALACMYDQRGTLRQGAVDIGAFQTSAAVSFRILAPAEVAAGEPFTVVVVALDAWGNTASTFTGTVHFDSSDPAAVLPGDYTFDGSEGGAVVVRVTLQTPGTQSVSITDLDTGLLTGSTHVLVRGV